jgi:HKD family nuclease
MMEILINDRSNNLKERLQELMPNVAELKILAGFFQLSGIKEFYETLKKLYDEGKLSQEHVKILVGLYSTDKNRNIEKKDRFVQGLIDSIKRSIETVSAGQELDNEDVYEQIEFFIKLLKERIIVIKKTLKPSHAKLYLFKTNKASASHFFVIGSSNLTRAGLVGQNELNIILNDDDGFKKVEEFFDNLWENAILLSEGDIRKLDETLEKEKRDAVVKYIKRYCVESV